MRPMPSPPPPPPPLASSTLSLERPFFHSMTILPSPIPRLRGFAHFAASGGALQVRAVPRSPFLNKRPLHPGGSQDAKARL
jgi:hypothetical protein